MQCPVLARGFFCKIESFMSSYLLRDADIRKAGNSRDVGGNAVKFSTFTVANGKVYVSKSTEVDVYGLLP